MNDATENQGHEGQRDAVQIPDITPETSGEDIRAILADLPPLPEGFSMVNPMAIGAVSLRQTLEPFEKAITTEDLTSYLTEAICHEDIMGFNDPAAMLAVQSRVLDAMFNRFVMKSVNYTGRDKQSNTQYLKIALQAQRQSRDTITALRKHAMVKNKNSRNEL